MNDLLRIAFDDKNKLIGKRVLYKGLNYDRIKSGQVFTVKHISVGNHDCFLHLKELPERLCFPFTSRTEGPGNIFNAKHFELEESE